MKASEVYENVTAAVITSIEEGIANPDAWSPPWANLGNYPTNAATGNAYRGGNVLAFAFYAAKHDYPTGWWATYKQWGTLHRQVRKGETATYGVKWIFPTPEAIVAARAKGQDAPRAFPKGFAVFNVAQTDAIDDEAWQVPAKPVHEQSDIVDEARAFYARIGADLHYGGDRAYYSPSDDSVHVPEAEQFHTPEGFVSVLAHEHTHWTGHADRCARDLTGRFGNDSYAAEELVAELGAAFTCARLAVEPEVREDHLHYLANWLRVLRSDSKALYKAASLAQAATDYIFETADKKVEVAA